MALTAKDSGVAKVLPKMSRPNYTALVHDLGIDTVISPKDVTAQPDLQLRPRPRQLAGQRCGEPA